MSKNTILPDGMYWYYNEASKIFSLIVEKDCKYQKITLEKGG